MRFCKGELKQGFCDVTLGQYLEMAVQRDLTMPALMLKRSSRVIPGFRGTPAGMMTTSDPSRA